MNYKLSVLIPVYNTRKYLLRCINSILLIKEIKYEIVLVDDGSIDGASELCDELAKKNENISVIHQKHSGLGAARIAGILASKGDFIGFIDSDDYINSQFYERLISLIDSDNSIDIAIGGVVRVETDGRKIKYALDSSPMSWSDYYLALEFLYKGFNWSLCDKIYSRQLFTREILQNWPSGYGEDLYVNSLLFPKARKISFLPLYGYNYCMNYDSMMHADFNSGKLDTIHLIDKVMNRYKNRGNIVVYLSRILINLSMDYFLLMHQRYPHYNTELIDCQSIINRWNEKLDIDAIRRNKLNILMKPPIVYHHWKKEMLYKLHDFCEKGKGNIYIYGIGEMGHCAAKYLLKMSIKFNGFIETIKTQDCCLDHPVYSLDEMQKDCYILLGLGMKNKREVYNRMSGEFLHVLDLYYYINCM